MPYFQIQEASLLFVDNPVGAGFRFVDDDGAYTTDVDQIAQDLLTLYKHFLLQNPTFRVCHGNGKEMHAQKRE